MSALVQIVPRLGPFDGVGDYALRLAECLRDRHGVISTFIEAGSRPGGDAAGFEVRRCGRRSPRALADALGSADRVLLHYVGYGYAQRGAPLWLARAAAALRPPRRRLGVVFHELYATGRFWQSSFWLGPLQKSVTTRIARACDGALLTREGNRQWLQATGALQGKRAEVLPVPCSVGEPAEVRPAGARDASLVVWGSTAMKRAVYGRHWPRVLEAARALGLDRIVDIGARADAYPADAPIALEHHGPLPAAEVSRILGAARFGLIAYPASFLAKSTLFAACAAHGVVPLVLDDSGSAPMDGLTPGTHYMEFARPQAAGIDRTAACAREWYSRHTVAHHAAAAWSLFEGAAA